MKKILIYAYTNFNLGDDLFIKILCERYPKTNFILYAPKNYKDNFSYLKNVKIVPSDLFLVKLINFILLKILRLNISMRELLAIRCDGIVNIGGSLFMQSDNWKEKIKRRKKISNKPFFLLGCNFGPYTDDDFYIEYKQIFEKYNDVCFRDKYSYNLFQDLKNVRYASDIVFQLKKLDFKQNNKTIAISVIKPSFRKALKGLDQEYYEKLREIIIHFVNKGFKVNLLSFCKLEGDEDAIEEILKNLPETYVRNVKKIYYRYNMNEMLKVIGSARFIIATRFHSMILGWLYHKPVFPIVYNKKMTNVIKDINFTGSYIDINNIDKLSVEDVYSSMFIKPIDITKQVIDSDRHFEKLDKFLLGG